MNQTEGTASGEVPESQPSGPDLAERIARELRRRGVLATTVDNGALVIRESLAPIREALETLRPEDIGDQQVLDYALRLLRGEELSGNRGFGGGE